LGIPLIIYGKKKLNMPQNTSNFQLLTSLLHESCSVHPGFQFCGDPPNAILQISEPLAAYVLSALRGVSEMPPKASSEEWAELFSVLRPHWVIPLLYWHIASFSPEYHPPGDVVSRMRGEFMKTRVRTLRLETQLHEVLAAFESRGIRVLLLKGPALARMVYPDTAVRQGSDIDLLVLPEQMADSREILGKLGYHCQEKRFEVSKDFYCEEKFFPKKNRNHCLIELHWDLHRFSGIRREAELRTLFEDAVRIVSPPLRFEALHPVDALIHRSLNNAFVHDRDMRLSWIYDVVFLARSLEKADEWELLKEKSVAWCARLALEHSLTLAQIWGGLVLPDEYGNFAAWPSPSEVETEAWHSATGRHENLSGYLRLHLSDSSLPEKIRFFIHLLFPSPDYMRMKYPPPGRGLLFLSYIRRWLHWLGIGCGGPLMRTAPPLQKGISGNTLK